MSAALVPPLAIFGSLAISEVVVVGAVALMIFGGRLPEVVMRGAAQLMRLRRVVTRMWREAGLEQELRRVQWEIERNMPRDAEFDLRLPNAKQPKAPPARLPGNASQSDATEKGGEGSEEQRDPAISLRAPAGTVAVAPPPVERSGADPAPRLPDLPPRDPEPPPAPPAPAVPPPDAALPSHERA